MSKFNVVLQFLGAGGGGDSKIVKPFPDFQTAYDWADYYVSKWPCSATIEHDSEVVCETELGALI